MERDLVVMMRDIEASKRPVLQDGAAACSLLIRLW
jgi:hypothetical protein